MSLHLHCIRLPLPGETMLQTLLLLLLLQVVQQQIVAIYPEDHFTFSKKLTTSNFDTEIKEAVDAGKEVIIRTDFMVSTDYLLASAGSEISTSTYSIIDIQGFGGARQYLKNFFEKFLITPRIYAAGDLKLVLNHF